MRKSRGFTLIEIIVAIAILGIVSVGFVPALMSNFTFLEKTKEITSNSFLSQKSMELAIEDMKDQIKKDTGSMGYTQSTLFDGVTVKYKLVENTFNSISYSTLVSQVRLPVEEKLNLLSVASKFYRSTKKLYNVYPQNDYKVVSSVVNDSSENWMANIYEWYVSDFGFNIPAPQGSIIDNPSYNYLTQINEIDIGNKYPLFPDDYSLISTVTGDSLNDLSKYAGRHIVVKVSPASKTGKIGNEKVSNPLFVSGLTETTNLVMHLDASYIDPTINSGTNQMVSKNGSLIKVLRWFDLSAEAVGVNDYYPSEYGINSGTPLLYENPIDASFIGRYVSFTSGDTISLISQGTSDSLLSLYAVIRGDAGSIILKNGNSTNYNSIVIPSNGDSTVELIGNSGEGTENWKIVKLNFNAGNNSRFNDFIIGGDDVDIAELLIYKGSHDSDKVSKYLTDKFKPYLREFEIEKLYDKTQKMRHGESLVLPQAVLAKMMYGGDRYVPVTWSNGGGTFNAVNTTDNVIMQTIVGSSLIGENLNQTIKTMNFSFEIYPQIKSVTINPSSASLNVDETVQLAATVLPSTIMDDDKKVTWSLEPLNTDVISLDDKGFVTALKAGIATVVATSSDGQKTGRSTITVVNNSPSIKSVGYLKDSGHADNTVNKVFVEFSENVSAINLSNQDSTNSVVLESGTVNKKAINAQIYWANPSIVIFYFDQSQLNINSSNFSIKIKGNIVDFNNYHGELNLSSKVSKGSKGTVYYRIHAQHTASNPKYLRVFNDSYVGQYMWQVTTNDDKLWSLQKDSDNNSPINPFSLEKNVEYNIYYIDKSTKKYLKTNDSLDKINDIIIEKKLTGDYLKQFRFSDYLNGYYKIYSKSDNKDWNTFYYALDIHSGITEDSSGLTNPGKLIRYTNKTTGDQSNQYFMFEPVIKFIP